MKRHTFIFVIVCLNLISFSASSTPNFIKKLSENITNEALVQLSNQKQWLDLLHYHRIGIFSTFESQADDTMFFLAQDGKTNALSELKATISAFKQTQTNDNTSAQCQFPARLNWLKNELGDSYFPIHTCTNYEKWFNKIDAHSITLIFPAAYLNSPSSMFGHTLIRINRQSGKNSLLDYSVNYAANADPDDNELVFSYKGLTGGYPGVFSVLPYYEKVNEYSFLESRDVWEYELKLNSDEVEQFVRHTWEIQNTYFDYYFFDENCSYHLLTILDASSPRLNLSNQFKLTAIPADTVRAISDANLIDKVSYRPSTLSLLKNMLNQTSTELQTTAKSLAQPNAVIERQTQALSLTNKAKTLELAYQYSRYLSVRKKQQSQELNKQAVALLSARSKLDIKNVYSSHPAPDYRDDEGHYSKRLATRHGTYRSNNENSSRFTDIGLRMAYHDLYDPIPGYIKGAKLEMFNFEFRHHHDHDKTRIESIKFIDIASLSARDELVTPISWHVSTGFKRPDSEKNELTAFLTSGAGISYQWGDHLFYSLLNGEFNLDNDIDHGYRVATGPRLGWLIQQNRWSAGIEANYWHDLAGAHFKEHNVSVNFSYNFSKEWQARVTSYYKQYMNGGTLSTHHELENTLSIMHYF